MTTVIAILDAPILVQPLEQNSPVVQVTTGTQNAINVVLAGSNGNVSSAWLPTEVSLIHKVTDGEISAKRLKLPSAPVSNFCLQHITGGMLLVIGRDFKVQGDYIAWDGLGLDGTMQSNDELFVRYFI